MIAHSVLTWPGRVFVGFPVDNQPTVAAAVPVARSVDPLSSFRGPEMPVIVGHRRVRAILDQPLWKSC